MISKGSLNTNNNPIRKTPQRATMLPASKRAGFGTSDFSSFCLHILRESALRGHLNTDKNKSKMIPRIVK